MDVRRLAAVALALGTGACATLLGPEEPRAVTGPATFEFEDVAVGESPAGWVATTTNARGAAGTWQVMQGPSVPSRTHVVGLLNPNHDLEGAFNILWTDDVVFRDGRIQVDVLPRGGRVDQGGGPIWRVQDAQNYYICRWNPLERNFRLYVVEDGRRRLLASADTNLAGGEWHRIEVIHQGDSIRCTLAGQTTIEATDATILRPGGVGFWTKADATTAFDGLLVRPQE